MKTTIEKFFGEILHDLRVEKKLTQAELADKSSLDRTYISLLERGERQPTISTLFKIASALETSVVSIVQKLMVKNKINRVIVTTAENKPIGIITQKDVVNFFCFLTNLDEESKR